MSRTHRALERARPIARLTQPSSSSSSSSSSPAAARACSSAMSCEAVHNVMGWYEEHKAQFAPPICNKMMHKKQMSVMFVGGPNTRKDFHIEAGSEFFFQLKGNMSLPTVQRGKPKVVEIKEGCVYLLPSRHAGVIEALVFMCCVCFVLMRACMLRSFVFR